MAVSGRRIQGSAMSDSLSKASDEDPDTSCQPCLFDGNNVTAIGYCQTCDDYLCKTCLNVHRKQSATRNHTILQNDQMPNGQSKSQENYFMPCKVHAGGIVKFYCGIHEVVGCGDCMVLEHKSCKVNLVTDVSADYIGGQKQSELNEYIKKFENKLHETKKLFKLADDEISARHEKVIADVKAFRKQIELHLDKVEADIIKEAMTEKKEQEKKIMEMKGVLKAMEDEIAEINRTRNSSAKQNSTVFITEHLAKTQVENVENALDRLQTNNSDRNYEFQSNDDIDYLLRSNSPLGHITKRELISCSDKIMEMEATFIKTIEVEACRFTGSTICPPGYIAVVDNLSNTLKMINSKDMKITDSLTLSYKPWDITLIKNNELAVTVPDQKKIQFIVQRKGTLKEIKAFEVEGECYGISNNDNKLIVSYLKPCKIEILNTDCRVLETIVSAERGSELFDMPRYIDVCRSTSNIYVSDYNKKTVTILTLDGHHLTTYCDKSLGSPQGLVVLKNGAFFMANYGVASISLVSPDFGKRKTCLAQKDGLKWPFTIRFVTQENKLFISNNNGRRIDVFQFN